MIRSFMRKKGSVLGSSKRHDLGRVKSCSGCVHFWLLFRSVSGSEQGESIRPDS